MSYRHLLFDIDRDRHVATITLNKPERLNAIDQQDKVDILDVIAKVQADDDVWVVIWTGAGRGFCSGADLQGPPPDPNDQSLNALLDEETWVSRQGAALYAIDKPMILHVDLGYPSVDDYGREVLDMSHRHQAAAQRPRNRRMHDAVVRESRFRRTRARRSKEAP